MSQKRIWDVNASEILVAYNKLGHGVYLQLSHNVCTFTSTLTPKLARQVAEKLIECAAEMEAQSK